MTTDSRVAAAEALAARRGLGVAAVGRGLLRLTGGDRVRFLQGLVTADVAALAPGAFSRAVILSVKGRVVAELRVGAEPDALVVATPPELTAKVLALLGRYAVADDVEIADRSAEVEALVLVGVGAAAVPAGPGTRAVPLASYGATGRELWLPPGQRDARVAELTAGGALGLGPEALEVLRIEAGEPRYGADVSEDDLPIEARLDGAISFTKGCYMGQEVIARATARGHINRKLVGLIGDAIPAVGAKLSAATRPEAGQVTSACWSAALGHAIALGYVHRSLWEPGTALDAGGVQVTVAALPFVP